MNKKLNSFTLSEMLVVLIITAIVVGLAFSVLSLVKKQVFKLQTDTDKKTQYDLVKNKLYFDFNTYSKAYIVDEHSFMFKNEIDSSIYSYNNALLVLNKKDTLQKNIKEIKFFYKNIEIKEGRIDAIKIVIEERKDIFNSIFAYKYNDATDLNDLQPHGF